MLPNIRGLIATGALTGAFIFVLSAHAHNAPNGWAYDAICCSNQDCAPAPSGAVHETNDGYLIVATGEMVARWDAKRSQDEDFHICRSQTSGRLLCLYAPVKGV
jgi:hypothetical protein